MKKNLFLITLLVTMALFLMLAGCKVDVGGVNINGSVDINSGDSTGDSDQNQNNDSDGFNEEDDNIVTSYFTVPEAAAYINTLTENETYTIIVKDDFTTSLEELKEALNGLSSTEKSGPYIVLDLTEATVLEIGANGFFDYVAFTYKYALKEITLPKNCKNIGADAFYKQAGLEKVTLSTPETLTSIEGCAFSYCSSLKEIDLSKCTQRPSIASYTFCGCSSLKEIDLSACTNLTEIPDGLFKSCSSLTSINIPLSVTAIGEYAFMDCSSLKSIDIPLGVTTIGISAFEGCTSFETIDLSAYTELTEIPDSAFKSCSSLKSIKIPRSVTTIGKRAFRYCSYLKDDGFTFIGDEEENKIWGYYASSNSWIAISDFETYPAYYLGSENTKPSGAFLTLSDGYNYEWCKKDDQ